MLVLALVLVLVCLDSGCGWEMDLGLGRVEELEGRGGFSPLLCTVVDLDGTRGRG